MPLDEQDKLWILGQMSRFATKEDLDRFASKKDLDRFATKEDLGRFATKEDLERFASKEDLEKVETTLLTEFHKWASPAEARSRAVSAALRALDAEMEALADRVRKLEEGRLPPN